MNSRSTTTVELNEDIRLRKSEGDNSSEAVAEIRSFADIVSCEQRSEFSFALIPTEGIKS